MWTDKINLTRIKSRLGWYNSWNMGLFTWYELPTCIRHMLESTGVPLLCILITCAAKQHAQHQCGCVHRRSSFQPTRGLARRTRFWALRTLCARACPLLPQLCSSLPITWAWQPSGNLVISITCHGIGGSELRSLFCF